MTESEVFESITGSGSSDFALLIGILNQHRPWCLLDNTQTLKVLGHEIPVASLDDVIKGKIWAWSDKTRRVTKRKKDELDLMRILEAHPGTRSLMPEQIRDQVPE